VVILSRIINSLDFIWFTMDLGFGEWIHQIYLPYSNQD